MAKSKQEKINELKLYFKNMKLDAGVMGRTLGTTISYVTPQLILDASKKLLKVFGRHVEADDRDNVIFSKFLGAEDYLKEHIDHTQYLRF